jgi:hypothetical protein
MAGYLCCRLKARQEQFQLENKQKDNTTERLLHRFEKREKREERDGEILNQKLESVAKSIEDAQAHIAHWRQRITEFRATNPKVSAHLLFIVLC